MDQYSPPAILVVDDNAAILKVVGAILQSAGFVVLLASDGAEGLATFQSNRASIALVLTDVMMPKMSGIGLADRILGLDPTVPILFMSGTGQAADRGHGCVSKPFKGSELLGRVGDALQGAPPWAMAAG